MQQIVTICDSDRAVDFVLLVGFTCLPAEPETGLGENVEINSVSCTEVVTWLGRRAVSAYPGREDEIGLERRMGEHCLEKYRDEITAALMELRSALAAE
jgi:hypothetical protein